MDWLDDEDGMQLALALSSSITEAGLPDEREERRKRRRIQVAEDLDGGQDDDDAAADDADEEYGIQAAEALDGGQDDIDAVTVAAADEEEEGPCFGSCLGLETTFVGEPCSKPDPTQPDGGWGYTPCCGNRVHFDCLGRWLKPEDAVHGTLVDSARGLVAMELKCPFCKKALSQSSRRMLTDGA